MVSTFLIFLIYLLGRNFHPWVDSSIVGREGRLGVTGSVCDLEKTTVKKVKKQQLRRLGVLDAVALGKVLVDGVVEEDEELLASLPEGEVSIFFQWWSSLPPHIQELVPQLRTVVFHSKQAFSKKKH